MHLMVRRTNSALACQQLLPNTDCFFIRYRKWLKDIVASIGCHIIKNWLANRI